MPKVYTIDELPPEVRREVLNEYRFVAVDYPWWEAELENFLDECEREYGLVFEKDKVVFDLDQNYIKVDFYLIDPEKFLKNIVSPSRVLAYKFHRARKKDDDFEWYFHIEENKILVYVEDDDEEKMVEIFGITFDEFIEQSEGFLEYLQEKLLERLKKTYEDLTSDEAVAEFLRAHDFRFTEDVIELRFLEGGENEANGCVVKYSILRDIIFSDRERPSETRLCPGDRC